MAFLFCESPAAVEGFAGVEDVFVVEVVDCILSTFMIIKTNKPKWLPQLRTHLRHHTRDRPIFHKFRFYQIIQLFLVHNRKLFYKQIRFLGDRVSGIPILEDLNHNCTVSKLGPIGRLNAILCLLCVLKLYISIAQGLSILIGSQRTRNNITVFLKEFVELFVCYRRINIFNKTVCFFIEFVLINNWH